MIQQPILFFLDSQCAGLKNYLFLIFGTERALQSVANFARDLSGWRRNVIAFMVFLVVFSLAHAVYVGHEILVPALSFLVLFLAFLYCGRVHLFRSWTGDRIVSTALIYVLLPSVTLKKIFLSIDVEPRPPKK